MKDINIHNRLMLRCRICDGDGSAVRAGCKLMHSIKGALTVEAAVVLPIILCAFFSVVLLIKTVYTYSLIQHALSETASEMASMGYIYHISGIRDLHDTVRNSVNERSDQFREQINNVFDAFDILRGTGPDSNSGNGTGGMGDYAESFNEIINHTGNIASDPLDELKTIVFHIAGGTFDDAKTQLFLPIVKMYLKKHLKTDNSDVNERLLALDIEGGFEGLDFSESSFFSDTNEDIDIVVRYKMRMPVPIKFTKDLEFVHRVRIKAWMGGDEKTGVLDDNTGSGTVDDIWSLSNFQRGLKIRRNFGANLPDNFPVIAKYENGKAVMIKSMDLTASSYQISGNAAKTLKGYINELAKYRGQNEPWGRDDIVIRSSDIRQKELLLVIPENELSDELEHMLSNMVQYADSKGIQLVIKRYGMKIIKEDEGDGADNGEAGSGGTETDDSRPR